MKVGNVELEWLGHAGFMIKAAGKIIYIDPYKIPNALKKADMLLITHSHYDHCSIEDIKKILKNGTIVICPADAQSKINKLSQEVELHAVSPNQECQFDNIKIATIPAYNKSKNFHPKESNWLGFIIRIEDTVIYHAGDTDKIKEMEKLTGYGKDGNEFVALLPIGGEFTMDVEEAVEAAKLINPTLAIPMHYGEIAGTCSPADADRFVALCNNAGIQAKALIKNQ